LAPIRNQIPLTQTPERSATRQGGQVAETRRSNRSTSSAVQRADLPFFRRTVKNGGQDGRVRDLGDPVSGPIVAQSALACEGTAGVRLVGWSLCIAAVVVAVSAAAARLPRQPVSCA